MKQKYTITDEGYLEVPITQEIDQVYRSLCRGINTTPHPRSAKKSLSKAKNLLAKAAILNVIDGAKDHNGKYFIDLWGKRVEVKSRGSEKCPSIYKHCWFKASDNQKEQGDVQLWVFVPNNKKIVWIVGGVTAEEWEERSEIYIPNERQNLPTGGKSMMIQDLQPMLDLDSRLTDQQLDEPQEFDEDFEDEFVNDDFENGPQMDLKSDVEVKKKEEFLYPGDAIEKLKTLGIKPVSRQHLKKLFDKGVLEGIPASGIGSRWLVEWNSLFAWSTRPNRYMTSDFQIKKVLNTPLPDGINSFNQLTPKDQLAKKLHVSVSEVTKMTKEKILGCYRLGRETRYHWEDVVGDLKEHGKNLRAIKERKQDAHQSH